MATGTSFDEVNQRFNKAQDSLGTAETDLRILLDSKEPIPRKELQDCMKNLRDEIDDFRFASQNFLSALVEHPVEQKRQKDINDETQRRVEGLMFNAEIEFRKFTHVDSSKKGVDKKVPPSGSPLQIALERLMDDVLDDVVGGARGGTEDVGDLKRDNVDDVKKRLDVDTTGNDVMSDTSSQGSGTHGLNASGTDALARALQNINCKLDQYADKLESIETLCTQQTGDVEVLSKNFARHVKSSKEVNSSFEQRVMMVENAVQEVREMVKGNLTQGSLIVGSLDRTTDTNGPAPARGTSLGAQAQEEGSSPVFTSPLLRLPRTELRAPRSDEAMRDYSAVDHDRTSSSQNDAPEESSPMMTRIMHKSMMILENMSEMMASNSAQQRYYKSSQRMPRHELMTFDGDPTRYQRFRDAFDDAVDAKESDPGTKLNILLHYCNDAVKSVLACCDAKKNRAEAYQDVLAMLEETYGSAFLVSQSWVNKLLALQSPKTAKELRDFSAEFSTCYATLDELKMTDHMSYWNLHMILSKLPMYMQIRWRTVFHDKLNETKREGAAFREAVAMVKRASKECNYPMFSPECFNMVKPLAQQYVQSHAKLKQSGATQSTKKTTVLALTSPITEPEAGDSDALNSLDLDDEEENAELMGEETCMHQGFPNKTDTQKKKPQRPRTKNACPCCDAKHYMAKCPVFLEMSGAKRLKFVRQQGLCLSCFARGHKVVDCGSKYTCAENECGAKHNTTLHYAMVTPIPNVDQVTSEQAGTMQSTNPVGFLAEPTQLTTVELAALQAAQAQVTTQTDAFTCMSPIYATATFLPVTPVLVLGVHGWIVAYALLDQGSSSSFCTKDLVNRLGIATMGPSNMTINTLTSAMDLKGERVNLNMSSLRGSSIKMAKNLLAIDDLPISSDYIVSPEQLGVWKHLSQLRFPAVKSARIDMLIGQNNGALIKSRERIDGDTDDDPYGVRTDLGWTIHGMNSRAYPGEKPSIPTVNAVATSSSDVIAEKLDKLWDLDHAEFVEPMSADDRKVLKLWDDSQYVEDGHLHIPIPFKDEVPNLPNNYPLAEKRLRQVSRKLEKDPVLKQKYITGMQDYLDSGYAEEVPDMSEGEPGLVNYSCHHPVEREDKPDVCRIVYDFSALFLGICLNMMVYAGPNLTGNLVDIILRFRQYGVIVMADIKAMFNQVRVPPRHRNVMRFLWWKDHVIGGQIVCYRMLTHAFGGIWSPSACNYALQKLVQLHGAQCDPITCDALLRSFYVDDCLRSILGPSVGIRLLLQLRDILSRIGFTLTKFSSNSPEVTRALPAADLAKGFESFHLDLSTAPKGKALGAGFDARDDMLVVRVIKINRPLTKRGMLSLLSSVFDPIGMLSPYVIRARMMFQQMCGPYTIEWDELIPPAIMGTWEAWIDDLEVIADFRMPRCISKGHPDDFTLSLHAFSDASENAYAAAVYAVVSSSGMTTALLLCSKARLTPLKATSIPRLELCGAVQSVKLMTTVIRALDIKPTSCHFWTDSMIVLSSIRAESRSFKTFVGNRLSIIQQASEAGQWHHVPTNDNPADMPSRGCGAGELLNSEKWKYGPAFLRRSEDEWPKTPNQQETFDKRELPSIKQTCLLTMVLSVQPIVLSSLMSQLLRDSSTWFRLQRSTAWLRRFILYIAGKPVPHGFITPRELNSAKCRLIAIAQRDITGSQRSTPKFRKLFPFEKDGLCRVGGRLKNAVPEVDYQIIHPLVLPPKHDITKLIIRSVHEEIGHVGAERTLTEIRKEFWILSSRKAIRQVLSTCTICQRLRSRPQEQLMADLPQVRVTPGCPPFHYTGLDFAGPFKIKIGRSQHNRYICVMTCFNTRAVHIEAAPGLDVTSFLNAFQRFISRRGAPDTVYSDNGTNFVGGNNELKEAISRWNQKQVHDYMLQRQIHWHFNTPYASHHGGVWERQIRTFRGIFLGLLRENVLTDDSLQTLICLVEQIMNSRPLTKISSDVHDDRPLTPNDLLILNSGTVSGPPGIFNRYDLLGDRWRKNQYIADQFWRRWIRQYLPQLQSRVKWYERAKNLKPGDLVMSRDEMVSSRLKWPLGLVTRVFPGDDGLVRSAEIRTKKGLYTRPIAKLYLLEGD